MDGFFLDGAVAIPHDVETLDGSSQALAVQRVARDFLRLAVVGWLLKPHTLGCRQSLPKPLQPSNPVLSPEVHTAWIGSHRSRRRIGLQERESAKRHRRILCLNLRKCYLHSMC